MEVNTQLETQCFVCKSKLNFESSQSTVEICRKFQIYITKFLNSVSAKANKLESEGNQSVSASGDDDHSKSKIISCCVQCSKEVETICGMWESLESLRGKLILAVVNISNLTKIQSQSEEGIIQQRSPFRDCFICQATPRSTPNSFGKLAEIDTCLKFVRFVTRFVQNTENSSFDKKLLQFFLQMENIKYYACFYCCDICMKEVGPFCEMYGALDHLRIEILRILDRISNKSKPFQSSVENHRQHSFPRVKLERLKCPGAPNPNQIPEVELEPNTESGEFTKVADSVTENQHQLDDDDFDNIEVASNGITSPSPSLHDHDHDHAHSNKDDNLDTPEAAPTKPANFLHFAHLIVKSKKSETETGQNLSRKRKPRFFGSGYKGTCLFCAKKLRRPYQLEQHMRSHTGERGYICRICLRECSIKHTLLVHRRKRHLHPREKNAPVPAPPQICEICGKSFRSRQKLTHHVRTVHEKLKPFQCDTCGKEFAQRIHLRAHQHSHGEKTELYRCDTCGKIFHYHAGLKKHIKAVHDPNKEKLTEVCHLCGKTLAIYRNSLLKHLNEHHRSEIDDSLKLEKKFKCSVGDCTKAFYDRRFLDRHMLSHTGERKFQCDQCGKAFTEQYKLNIHKEIHKEVRPYVCTHCGKGYNYRHRLRQHLEKCHSTDNIVNSDNIIGKLETS